MNVTIVQPKVDYKTFKLTFKQAKFVDLVLNANQAQWLSYKEVFKTKSDASAVSGASRLLAKANVQEYKAALEAYAASSALDNTTISQERILQEEACLAFIDIADFVDETGIFIKNIRDIPERLRRAVGGFEVTEKLDPTTGLTVPVFKVKLLDKGRSLERLEKHLGMLTDKVEIGVEVTFRQLVEQIDGKKTGQPMIPHLKD